MTAVPALPRACGYFRLPAHLSEQSLDREVALLRARITEHARALEWCMATVLHDTGRGDDHAFYVLLGEIRRSRAVAVVVPDLAHLTQIPALSGADRLTLARYLRAAVAVLPPND